MLPPVQTLVDPFIFASGENANRIRPPPPKTCDSQTANSYATGSYKPPLSKGGGFASGKTGGIPQAGRFPHWSVLSGKSPTVNPSVTATPCQLPLAREPLGCSDEAPLAIVGVVWRSQTGGIPQAGRFPYRFVLSRSANCESLSHGYAVPAPFGKGALRAVPADNAHGNLLRIVTAPPVPGIVSAVVVEAQAKAPLAKGGWFCLWQNRGDSIGLQVST